jgi:hypothetical protein
MAGWIHVGGQVHNIADPSIATFFQVSIQEGLDRRRVRASELGEDVLMSENHA